MSRSSTVHEAHVGPYPNPPRGAWRIARGAVRVALSWIGLGAVLTVATIISLATLRIWAIRLFPFVARLAGGLFLALAGVRVRVKGAERIAGRRARIVVFNHTSQLDLFVFASLMPPRGTALAKKAIYAVPFIGWAMFSFKVLHISRTKMYQAKRTLRLAAQRLQERRATVLIAPEGTRSRDGKLAPFKMGAFHLAMESRAPIIPAIVRGARECQPMGAFLADPGVVEVEFLEEIPTDDFTDENIHQKRDEIREIFVRLLDGEA